MISTLLRWSDVGGTSLLAEVDNNGQTALTKAIVNNSTAVARMLLAGRPLRPAVTKTSCPPGSMAGDKVHAWATYAGTSEGKPAFSILWMSKIPQEMLRNAQCRAQSADGLNTVALHQDRQGKPVAQLPRGTVLTATAQEGE